ncbi:hypothetical protein GCM10027436_81730 [Actinophytocola sediminis]
MTRRSHRIHSTGAEATSAAPVTTHATIGAPTSTDAEPFDDTPVTTRVSHLDEPITVHSPTPGPVTMTVGWLTDTSDDAGAGSGTAAEAKVIAPAERPGPEPTRRQAQTKPSRNRGRAGNR